jgi:hypothetical protein
VIWIDFSEAPRNGQTYTQYINRIENQLLKNLTTAYPDSDIDPEGAVWDALKQIFAKYHSERFFFILDEWDAVFHLPFVTKSDQEEYLRFYGGRGGFIVSEVSGQYRETGHYERKTKRMV